MKTGRSRPADAPLLPPIRLGPPCRWPILIATKAMLFRGQVLWAFFGYFERAAASATSSGVRIDDLKARPGKTVLIVHL
jgi:hypothetical protein